MEWKTKGSVVGPRALNAVACALTDAFTGCVGPLLARIQS